MARNVTVSITANVAGAIAGLGKLSAAAKATAGQINRSLDKTFMSSPVARAAAAAQGSLATAVQKRTLATQRLGLAQQRLAVAEERAALKVAGRVAAEQALIGARARRAAVEREFGRVASAAARQQAAAEAELARAQRVSRVDSRAAAQASLGTAQASAVAARAQASNAAARSSAALASADARVAAAEGRMATASLAANSALASRAAAAHAVTVAQGRLTASTASVVSSQGTLARAQAAASGVFKRMGSAIGAVAARHEDISRVAGAMGRLSLVTGLIGGGAAKAAIDWQKAWTGVTKTVDFTQNQNTLGSVTTQMNRLEASLREISRTTPEAFEVVTGVAQQAGALGVPTQNVSEFVRTMIQLGDVSDLSASEGAEAFARFMNVVNASPASVHRLASAVVDLGINSASTEKEIVTMATLSGSAGRNIGLSADQVLAFSSAVASTGIKTEAGGSALARVFTKIDAATRSGGKGLEALAKTSGKTSAQFIKDFGRDPAKAIDEFVHGLARIQAKGGDVTAVLADLSIRDVRETRVMRNLARATRELGSETDLLSKSLDLAKKGVLDDTALNEAASKRYLTAAARMGIAVNNIRDAGVTLGSSLLPIISTVADKVTDAARSFQGLDDGTQSFIAKGTGSVAVIVGVGAALLGLTGFVARGVTGFIALTGAMGAAGVAARGLVAALGPVGLAFAAVSAAGLLLDKYIPKPGSIDEITRQLIDLGKLKDPTAAVKNLTSALPQLDNKALVASSAVDAMAGGVFELVYSLVGGKKGVDDFRGALLKINSNGPIDVLDRIRAAVIPGTQSMERYEESVKATDKAFAAMVQDGSAAEAGAAFAKLTEGLNLSPKQYQKSFGDYAEQLKLLAAKANVALKPEELVDFMKGKVPAALREAAKNMPELKAALGTVTQDVKQLVAATQAANESLYAVPNALLAAKNAMLDLGDAQKAATDTIEKNGKQWGKNTQGARDNKRAIYGYIGVLNAALGQMAVEGASQDAINTRRAKSIKTLRKMGKAASASGEEIRWLIRQLIKTPEVTTARIVTPGAKISAKEAAKVNLALKDIPKEKRASVITIAETKGAKAAFTAMERIKDKEVIAKSKGDLKGAKQVDAAMKALKDRKVKAEARGDKTEMVALKAAIDALYSRHIYITTHVTTVHDEMKKKGGNFTTPGRLRIKERLNAAGGYISGPGSGTSDSIPAWLSNGEFVIRARAVKAIGVGNLHTLNSMGGYANGGLVGGYASGGAVDARRIAAFLRALENPLADVQAARRKVRAEQEDVREAKGKKARAKQEEELKAATKALTEAQKAAAAELKSISADLSGKFRSESHDIDDWLEKMKEGAADLGKFKGQIAKLRKLGVSNTIIKRISDLGATVGSELADQIIAGGKKMARAINNADENLTNAADDVAKLVGTKPIRRASGGPVFGPGTATSDSIPARLSNGEYVVNAAATRANRVLLDSINYGTSRREYLPAYAYGGYVTQPRSTTRHIQGGDVNFNGPINVIDPDQLLRKAKERQRDSMIMLGLSVAI